MHRRVFSLAFCLLLPAFPAAAEGHDSFVVADVYLRRTMGAGCGELGPLAGQRPGETPPQEMWSPDYGARHMDLRIHELDLAPGPCLPL